MDELNDLMSSLPGYNAIPTKVKQRALDGSLKPDAAGIWPGKPGYTATYDVYYAAYSLVGYLKAQPVVRQSSSEGTSVSVDAPDWDSLEQFFWSQSPILSGTGSTLLRILPIPDVAHVKRVPMDDKNLHYGDVDTDV